LLLDDWIDCDPETGRQVAQEEVKYYPPVNSRPKPQWSEKLRQDLQAFLDEVYSVLHSGWSRLSAMGARALLDAVLQDKVGYKDGSLCCRYGLRRSRDGYCLS